MRKISYGIWTYSILCLVLVLLYRYYTAMFETKIAGYNLSLWSALIVNLVLLIASILSLKESKLLSILGIILSPVSTYLFYVSWTEFSYEYLVGFLVIPIVLLVIMTVEKLGVKGVRPETLPERPVEREAVKPAT